MLGALVLDVRRVLHGRKNAMDESETFAVSVISAIWATKVRVRACVCTVYYLHASPHS